MSLMSWKILDTIIAFSESRSTLKEEATMLSTRDAEDGNSKRIQTFCNIPER
jgi:hypothetical protein